MRRFGLLLLALPILASCGRRIVSDGPDGGNNGAASHGPAPSLAFQSGTRLRAKIIDGGGGARLFDGWYDTVLKTSCTFHRAEDGTTRCFPRGDKLIPAQFAGVGCTGTRIVNVDECVKAGGPYVATFGTSTVPHVACGADLTAQTVQEETAAGSYRIGTEQSLGTLYQQSADGCEGFTSSGTVGSLDPVDLSTLASATRQVEERGSSIAVETIEGEDGSKWPTGTLFDVALQQSCSPSYVYGVLDDYRCYVATAQRASADAACQSPGGLAACQNELVIDNYTFCGAAPDFYQLGDEIATSTVYDRIASTPDATCGIKPMPVPPGRHFFSRGARYPFDEFPELTSDLIGTGRLRLSITRAVDDGRGLFVNPELFGPAGHYRPGPFWDTAREMACKPMLFQDGITRCVPIEAVNANEFADPACTVPIVEKQISGPALCGEDAPLPVVPPPYGFVTATGCFPTPVVALYTMGPWQQRASAYYWRGDSPPVCAPLTNVTTSEFYDLVPANPADLPALTVETE